MAERVSILGAGSWGMAIARLLDANGVSVKMWEFDPDEYQKLVRFRGIPDKLAGVKLAESISFTNDLGEAIDGCQLIVMAVPSQVQASTLVRMKGQLDDSVHLVNLAKGIETTTLRRMSQVMCDEAGVTLDRVATISGPSHAEEVALDIPTTVVAAGIDREFIAHLQELFSNKNFRVYSSDDLVGVELAGSLKNIIAIGVGITDGLGMGDNTRGALITRGLAELTRLGLAMGAQAETFAGLSGIGDLITTCTSRHSRNRHVGEKIGQGKSLDEVLESMTMVAEGVQTTRSGKRLAQLHEVEMPITQKVYEVLFDDKSPAEAVNELMGRTLKAEVWL